MFDSYESTIGERIRYYRQRAGLTQKALAEACGISDPAIRNYELGNRIPNKDTLGKMADALRIEYYALADPNLDTLAGVMHCFFRMEYAHGLKPIEIDGKAVLIIDPNYFGVKEPVIQQLMNQWLEARKKYDTGEWSIDQYEDWESRFPFAQINFPQEYYSAASEKKEPSFKTVKQKHPQKKHSGNNPSF